MLSAPPSLTPPPLDLRALALALAPGTARRLAVPAALAALLVVLALALGGPARTFADALARAATADPRWFGAAVVLEALSFLGYVALLWHVAGGAAPRVDLRTSVQLTLAGTAATRLLPTAGAGGAALTLWGLRRAGQPGRLAARTLLEFLVLLYAVFLGAILVVGALAATGAVAADGPLVLSAAPAGAAAVAIALALALGRRAATGAERDLPGGRASVLGEAVLRALAHVRGRDPRLLGGLAWWGFDLAVLWATFHAVGAPPPLAALALGYLVGQVANTLPVPGSASGGMIGVLVAFGGDPDVVVAAVLAYRAVAIWLPAPAGLAAVAGLRRTIRRWAAEDAGLLARPGRVLPGRSTVRPRARRRLLDARAMSPEKRGRRAPARPPFTCRGYACRAGPRLGAALPHSPVAVPEGAARTAT